MLFVTVVYTLSPTGSTGYANEVTHLRWGPTTHVQFWFAMLGGSMAFMHYFFLLKAFEGAPSTVLLPLVQVASVSVLLGSSVVALTRNEPWITPVQGLAYALMFIGGILPSCGGQLSALMERAFWRQSFVYFAILAEFSLGLHDLMLSGCAYDAEKSKDDHVAASDEPVESTEFFVWSRVSFVLTFIGMYLLSPKLYTQLRDLLSGRVAMKRRGWLSDVPSALCARPSALSEDTAPSARLVARKGSGRSCATWSAASAAARACRGPSAPRLAWHPRGGLRALPHQVHWALCHLRGADHPGLLPREHRVWPLLAGRDCARGRGVSVAAAQPAHRLLAPARVWRRPPLRRWLDDREVRLVRDGHARAVPVHARRRESRRREQRPAGSVVDGPHAAAWVGPRLRHARAHRSRRGIFRRRRPRQRRGHELLTEFA